MPPAEYLASSYYERWLWAVEQLAAEQGLLDSAGDPRRSAAVDRASRAGPDRFRPRRAGSGFATRSRPATPASRGTCAATSAPSSASCSPGPNPGESAATGRYGRPELVYTVAFAAADCSAPTPTTPSPPTSGESDLEDAA